MSKFKALIIDLDGTTVGPSFESMPSRAVEQAIKQAGETVKISICTGRTFAVSKHVAQALDVHQPSIFNGGAEILDPLTGKALYQKLLTVAKQREVLEILKRFDYKIYSSNDEYFDNRSSKEIDKRAAKLLVEAVPEDEAIHIIEELEAVPQISVYPVQAWHPGKVVAIHITDGVVNKKHAVEKLLKILKIPPEQAMAIGDGHNDLPLLAAVGFKVAMGNAPKELKAAADYIAPTFEEDGVAHAINKFILENK